MLLQQRPIGVILSTFFVKSNLLGCLKKFIGIVCDFTELRARSKLSRFFVSHRVSFTHLVPFLWSPCTMHLLCMSMSMCSVDLHGANGRASRQCLETTIITWFCMTRKRTCFRNKFLSSCNNFVRFRAELRADYAAVNMCWILISKIIYTIQSWRCSSVFSMLFFGRRTFSDLCPICGWLVTIFWVNCPQRISQLVQLGLPSLWGRLMNNIPCI